MEQACPPYSGFGNFHMHALVSSCVYTGNAALMGVCACSQWLGGTQYLGTVAAN